MAMQILGKRLVKTHSAILRNNLLQAPKLPVIVTFFALATNCCSIRGCVSSFISLPVRISGNRMPSSLLSLTSPIGVTDSDSNEPTATVGTWAQDTTNRQKALKRCIVPLSASSYKGSSGRVGILGGSARYTGAPYYAAMSALKVGADLAFCFCAEEASLPLKSYSPELMVAPVYKAAKFDKAALRQKQQKQIKPNTLGKISKADGQFQNELATAEDENGDKCGDADETEYLIEQMVEEVCSMIEKLHVLVIGPGLGRCPIVLEATARIIRRAQSIYHLPLVIDADALFLLTLPKYRDDLLSNDSSAILTPNAMELKRIRESGISTENLPDRCLVIEKGAVDVIRPAVSLSRFNDHDIRPNNTSNGATAFMKCEEVGGLKRSGGIGDILSGACGTLVAWNHILTKQGKATSDDLPLACWTACCFVKRSTKVAFDRHRRSMTAPDILHEIGPVIDKMT